MSNSRSEEEVLISRIIEKALRRSRAIDTEGLCIVAGEKVWQIRVDLLFLDHDGNLVDCASIAAITALLHFRRPDVTVLGEDVTIVSVLRACNRGSFTDTFFYFSNSIQSIKETLFLSVFTIYQSVLHLHSSTTGKVLVL